MSIFDIHSTVLADYRDVTRSFIWFFEEQSLRKGDVGSKTTFKPMVSRDIDAK